MAVSNLYMNSGRTVRFGRRGKSTQSDWVRNFGPYVATALLILFVLWGVENLKKDIPSQQDFARPLKPDWTHKLHVEGKPQQNQYDWSRGDDPTHASCPTPVGNWPHTCDENLIIEGPCSGKCLLKAKCQNVKENLQETTFEYPEYRVVEIKNVNGLLCKLEDGDTPSCGVNFHGNMALRNCAGYIPTRREKAIEGLHNPPATPYKANYDYHGTTSGSTSTYDWENENAEEDYNEEDSRKKRDEEIKEQLDSHQKVLKRVESHLKKLGGRGRGRDDSESSEKDDSDKDDSDKDDSDKDDSDKDDSSEKRHRQHRKRKSKPSDSSSSKRTRKWQASHHRRSLKDSDDDDEQVGPDGEAANNDDDNDDDA